MERHLWNDDEVVKNWASEVFKHSENCCALFYLGFTG